MPQRLFRDGLASISRRRMLAGAAALPALALLRGTVRAAEVPPRTRFGVNFYSLFLRGLKPGQSPATDGLADLAHAGIPFVRFPASGQRAGDWSLLDTDPGRYWGNFDAIFATAEQTGIKLVPSLFWNPPTLPFHLGETMQSWLNPDSSTARHAQAYVETFRKRYDKSPALLMYEFGNELNSWLDLPNVTRFWPKPDPTMPERKPLPADALSSSQFSEILDNFVTTLRKSSTRGIGSGNNIPRENAWHLAHRTWDIDTRDQYIETLRSLCPRDMDVLSIHLYPNQFGGAKAVFQTPGDVLAAMVEAARLDNRTAFVGEFGIARMADNKEERRQFAAMVDAIIMNGVDYAAIWNYAPFAMQPDYDVTFTNDRAYQLQAILAANKG